MSFLKRDINGEEPNQSDDLEEQYKRLMPKIGRDFPTRDDLESFVSRIMEFIDPLGLNPFQIDDGAARDLAQRYKRLVEKGKEGGEKKRDLVKIDEDEDDS